MRTKRWFLFLLLGVICLLLLAGCGRGNRPESTGTSSAPVGTSTSHTENDPVGTNPSNPDAETQRITAPDPDDDLNGPVYTVPPYVLEDDDPLAVEIQAALDAKEPKLIWAEDCFVETRQEAKRWHYTYVDCNGFFEDLVKYLFQGATEKTREKTVEVTWIELQLGQNTIRCISDVSGRSINLFWLPTGVGEERLPKAVEYLAGKTGVELREWTDFDTMRIDAVRCYTGNVDGIQIGASCYQQITSKLSGYYGVELSPSGNIEFCSPISIGEEAGIVRLNDSFSQEELRSTLEFDFDPSLPEITVYRSCRLCYLIHEGKELLVPVWWVKGVRFNLETGEGRPFEIVFDAETGEKYRYGGL